MDIEKRRFPQGAWPFLSAAVCAGLAAWAADNIPSPPSTPPIFWREVTSPLFPTQWPPAPGTVWVRYTFAYGRDVNLIDGERVSRPLARTAWHSISGEGATVELSGRLEPVAIQGVVPLDEATVALLSKGPQLAEICLSLTGLPTPKSSQTTELIAYYRAWFRFNGAFLQQIHQDHEAFIAWIEP